MRKTLTIAALAAVGLAAAALTGVGLPEQARGEEAASRTVTVTGIGTVEARPDEASFSFGVDTRAETAEAASDENAAAMRRLIDALKAAGVDGDDIQTQSVSVWPVADEQRTHGYTASNSVQVTTTVADAGRLVEVATGAGATTVWGPSLSLGDSHELEEQALQRALDDARRKGGVLAAAAGAELGEVVKVVEGAGGPQPYAVELAARAEAGDGAPPIEPGKLERSATLTVTFRLQ